MALEAENEVGNSSAGRASASLVNVGMFFLESPALHGYKTSNILVGNSKGVFYIEH